MSAQVVDHTVINYDASPNRLVVTVECGEGPTHGRVAGGFAAAYGRKHGVKLRKLFDNRSWTYGFLHRTEVTYAILS